MLHRDAFASSRLSESQTTALVARLWESMASPVNTARIGADVDVSHDAVARHIGYLRDSYLLWSCPQTADGAFIRHDRTPEKLYHRTKNRKEIDFVGEPLAGAAVEGKYTETGKWRGEAATVEASEWQGILTTRNVLDCSAPSGPWAVPAGLLAALVDT